ncbi:hypothetical protein [Nonomuraea lactucae]|uniref:hypothetical protein n=1 Tax=Nonomuraea lactucae TaxID=2249762 RepID=UPI0013B3941A|nr:hypothetical protein [Nonomuraea lactucae]
MTALAEHHTVCAADLLGLGGFAVSAIRPYEAGRGGSELVNRGLGKSMYTSPERFEKEPVIRRFDPSTVHVLVGQCPLAPSGQVAV